VTEPRPAPAAEPESGPRSAPPAAGPGAHGPFRPLQLNHASAPELDALPGIGPVLARRIVEHRTRYGPFRSREELRAVRGTGPALVSRLEGLLAADSL